MGAAGWDGDELSREGDAVAAVAQKGVVAGAGLVLLTLAAGQFVMALDTTVMNTAIATVAKDVGTRR